MDNNTLIIGIPILILAASILLSVFIGRKKSSDKKNNSTIQPQSLSNEFDEKYLFDFKLGYKSGWSDITTGGGFAAGGSGISNPAPPAEGNNAGSSDESKKKEDKTVKIALTPKQVLNELEVIPTPFSLELLDEKISILKDKEKLITQKYAKREITALVERATNRKRYTEKRLFWEKFQNTDEGKINALLEKHKHLVMKSADIFIPEFPDDAVKIMKEYTANVEELCGKKPVFYVIAEDKDFKKADEKRDPILLVQSPFGFFYQICGAWAEEMLLLSEL